MRRLQRFAVAGLAGGLLLTVSFVLLDRLFPLPFEPLQQRAGVVLDRHGDWLYAAPTRDGLWDNNVVFAQSLARVASLFGTVEYFWLYLLGLGCAVVATRGSPLRGALGLVLGVGHAGQRLAHHRVLHLLHGAQVGGKERSRPQPDRHFQAKGLAKGLDLAELGDRALHFRRRAAGLARPAWPRAAAGGKDARRL